MICANWAAASGSVAIAWPSVSAAERIAVTGVRSSCEAFATKSFRIASSLRTSVSSTKIASTPAGSPLSGAACTSSDRLFGPGSSTSPPTFARSRRACSSSSFSFAWRTSSSTVRPSAPGGSASICRSAGFTRTTRPSRSSRSTPSPIPSRMRPSRSRSPRSASRLDESPSASRSRVWPSTASSWVPVERARAVSSPCAIRCATPVTCFTWADIQCAAIDERAIASPSATSVPQRSSRERVPSARLTSSTGSATRATPTIAPDGARIATAE